MATVESVSSDLAYPSASAGDFHTVQRGEDLASIGKQYGFTEKAMIAANPEIANPDRLYPGDRVVVPDGPTLKNAGNELNQKQFSLPFEVKLDPKAEVKGAEIRLDGRATSQDSVDTKFGLSEKGFKVDVGTSTKTKTPSLDPNGYTSTNTVSSSTGIGINRVDGTGGELEVNKGIAAETRAETPGGYGVHFKVSGNASASAQTSTKDGVTTYASTVDLSASVKAGVSVPQGGLEKGLTQGVKATFEVSLPEAAAKTATLESINPFDPSSMPEGTVIKMDGAQYSTNEFKATFKNIAIQTKVTDETGVSIAVEKTGDSTVRVTAGPTEAIKSYQAVGFEFGKASVALGRSDTLSSASLKTAHFDLSTPRGQAQYNEFLVAGKLPQQNGAGISDVASIERFDYKSTIKLDAKYRFIDLGFDVATHIGNSVSTTNSDGTVSRTVEIQYPNNVPMTVTQKWDAAGNEIMSERQYTYTAKLNATTATALNRALKGDSSVMSGIFEEGQNVTIRYGETQMAALMEQTRAAGKLDPQLASLVADPGLSPTDFAVSIARGITGTDHNFVELMHDVANFSDGDVRGLEKIDADVAVIK